MKNAIAVVDDGINEKLYNTGLLTHNIEITPGLDVLERVAYDPYLPSHGTTCAAIIKKYAPCATFSSVKILNDQATGLRKQLIRAIQWCVENGIRLVNLSLGTISYRDFAEIRKAVNDAYNHGLIIVAACDNREIFTCPASLSNVIGVKCDQTGHLKKGEYAYNHYALDGVEITARGRHTLLKDTGKKRITNPSNSFAAPFVTALAHDLMIKSPGISLPSIKDKLRKGAVNYSGEDYRPYLYKNLDWVEKAVVFTLSRPGNLLDSRRFAFAAEEIFTITCRSLGEGLDQVKDLIRKKTGQLVNPETIVIDVDDPGLVACGIEARTFFEEMSNSGKNVVYLNEHWLEDEVNLKINDNETKIWHPLVSRYFRNNSGNQLEIGVPVIAVYDFESRSLIETVGSLSDFFKQDGYNTMVCSDNCSEVVAGFEYTPFGVNTENIDTSWLKCLYRVYDPDLILLGINAGSSCGDYLKKLEQSLEIDVKITLVKNPGSSKEKIFVNETTQEITLNLPAGGLENNPLPKECYSDLYTRLLNLFEQHNS